MRARKMAANAIKKIQVPAYCPAEVGDQAVENSGVVVEVKKVIDIMLIGIMLLEFICIESDVALVVAMGIDMVMLAMSLIIARYGSELLQEKGMSC